MSSDVSNARGRKKAARREKNGEKNGEFSLAASPLAKIPRGLRPRGASGFAAKAPAKEIPPATRAKEMKERKRINYIIV